MTPLAWLIGLFLPACAAFGAQGLPHPTLMDMDHIQRPASPNTALVNQTFEAPAPRLYAAVLSVAAEQPRTYFAAEYATARQVHYVVRSAVFNFPDLVVAQVTAAGPDSSTLVLYSRSVYGYSDLGVNQARLKAWLAALDRTLNPAKER